MSRTAAETRSHILGVAEDLFYWKGIRATGVDLVAAEAGVAPTTLYRLFASKDALVGAYVEHSAANFQELLGAAVAAAGPDPREQILAAVDAAYAQVDSGRFRGCAMMMALAEFPDPELPAHRNALAAKAWLRERLGELTGRLGAEDPAELADYLTLIIDGMHSSAQSYGPTGPARQARRLAEAILPDPGPRPAGAGGAGV